ncbi:MAG: hypothetical protein IT364_05500 [Candidatus Hydrogenedentes bacterium]|nr:hypothetical protein [Candidatus Hydrogenedentota bacterium]
MSKTIRTPLRAALMILAVMITLPDAHAFYPLGYFDPETGQLTFVKWPLDVLDVDGDGDVSGDEEGIPLTFETGNGEDGFTTVEVDKLFLGCEEWERVASAYIAFRQTQPIVDPVELTAGFDAIDAFNTVAFESEDDITEQGGSLVEGAQAMTFHAYTVEDTAITIGGTSFFIGAGEFVDVDTVVAATAREVENTSDEFTLQGLATLFGGMTIGLGYSPLTNLDESASETEGINVEDRVVALRGFNGELIERGVTSSMFNAFLVYVEENGSYTDSHADLAPDDIAGVTFLYPRSSIDIFFNLNQRARTKAREGFASQPIAGAWIRAGCDADNNSGTARVPMFDTFTGLYEWEQNTDFRGHFELKGLIKQLETVDEIAFVPTYTFSCSEFLPVLYGGDERSVYDTTHGGFMFGDANGFGFDSLFPSEVFAEGENLSGMQNVNQGAALYFDLERRKIVSEVSGKTLDVLLAAGRPMFGDQTAVCPLNVIVAGLETVQGPTMLRGLRDKVLLNSAAGTALVDAYYRMSPVMAQYLLDHGHVLAAARVLARGLEWMVVHAEWLLASVTLLLCGLLGRRYYRRLRGATALLALAGAATLFAATPADALLTPYDISDYVCLSTDVIHGEVTAVESYWTDNNTRIVTDVTVTVSTVIKGEQNKNGQVHFQLPTGRVGAIVRSSPDLPSFARGEEVVLFLKCQERGFAIMGGIAGKYAVKKDPRTGEKYVLADSISTKTRLEKEIKKMNAVAAVEKGEAPPAKTEPVRAVVSLHDFVAHLRRVERESDIQNKHNT